MPTRQHHPLPWAAYAWERLCLPCRVPVSLQRLFVHFKYMAGHLRQGCEGVQGELEGEREVGGLSGHWLGSRQYRLALVEMLKY